MKTIIKLLIVLDEDIDYKDDIEKALIRQKRDYEEGSDGKLTLAWQYTTKRLRELKWVDSPWGKSYRWIDPNWIRDNVKAEDPNIYSIAFVFKYEHWKAPGIGGWSMGFYNGFHIQLIRGMSPTNTANNVYSMYVTFLEELFHGWDEFIWYELGLKIETKLGVEDFDRENVHAEHPDETRWDYQDEIKVMTPYLLQIFSPVKLMELVNAGKQVWAVMGNIRLWILDPETYNRGDKKLWDIKKRSQINLYEKEYGGAIFLSSTDDPILIPKKDE